MCRGSFQIYGVHIPRKCINLRYFYSCCSPTQNSPPSSYHHATGRSKLLIPRQHSFKNLFPPTAERGEGNYDLLYRNSVK